MRRLALVAAAGLFVAGSSAFAQTPQTIYPDRGAVVPDQQDSGFNPFLSGDARPSAPAYSFGARGSQRSITSGDNYNFDNILAPGQRERPRRSHRTGVIDR